MDADNSLPLLEVDALVRSIKVNRNTPHALLLGAGASISSGIPSAWSCIWEWKRQIFLTKNPGLEDQFQELSLNGVRQKIQRWLDNQGQWPDADSPDEYGRYIKACYPLTDDRRQFFQEICKGAKPYIGYRLLCLLAQAGIVKSTWTTNFDGLVARAAVETSVVPVEVGLDGTHRVIRQPREGELLCIALHGDYRYDPLKNTPPELLRQDEQLRKALIERLEHTTLIVCGYSGRDASIMEALTAAYSQSGTGRLFWCGHEGTEPLDSVTQLLATAKQHGRIAYYVPTSGFDDLMIRLSLNCLTDDLLIRAQELHSASRPDMTPPAFSVENSKITGIVRSNAYLIECPSEVLQFPVNGLDGQDRWRQLRVCTEGYDIVAGLFKGEVLAFGTVDDIKRAFAGKIAGEIRRGFISEKELAMSDGIVISMLTGALLKAIAGAQGFNTDGKHQIWLTTPRGNQVVLNTRCRIHDAARLYLRRFGGKQYLIVKPTIKGSAVDGGSLPQHIEDELKRQILTKQYNKQFSDALSQWTKLIFSNSPTVFEFPANCASAFRFSVKRVPILGSICEPKARQLNLRPEVSRHCKIVGTKFIEPPLVFSNKRGDAYVSDIYPVRGITENRPYDFSLNHRGLGNEIKLGIICPIPDANRLTGFLNRLHQRRSPETKQEYLLEYPGFANAFGLPLDIPQTTSKGWVGFLEPATTCDAKAGAIELSAKITRAIDALSATFSPNVILVYVPTRFESWTRYEADGERFDLHDFVKAYCVQHGIATQFLRETTITKSNQCEVLWWLALSFYTKAMRTPWVLQSFEDSDTAFLGLGFSQDQAGARGKHITLGCSHIYNSQGLGLSYKLSAIEKPFWRQGNPFMSLEDARRTGDNVRQLFFDAIRTLPNRVVIHKRTPFSDEEKKGLLDGLSGVDTVDMIEVNIEPALRFMAAQLLPNGKMQGDMFPIARNTALVLDAKRALVWVHGTTPAIQANRRYYQGKSRIPAPLAIRRHYGSSDLGVLATEILGLSKMNWNTFDMYTKIPATIASSNEIARIGALLERFTPASYDYRLFI
jgi:hypothetical protein